MKSFDWIIFLADVDTLSTQDIGLLLLLDDKIKNVIHIKIL